MTENIYKPPEAPVELATPGLPDHAALKRIRNAWIAGVVSAGITLIFVLVSVVWAKNVGGIDATAFVDVLLMLALSYGVYRRSRTCAVALFSVFLLNKIVMWATAGQLTGVPVALVFLWFFGQGIAGTFQYHKLRKQAEGAA